MELSEARPGRGGRGEGGARTASGPSKMPIASDFGLCGLVGAIQPGFVAQSYLFLDSLRKAPCHSSNEDIEATCDNILQCFYWAKRFEAFGLRHVKPPFESWFAGAAINDSRLWSLYRARIAGTIWCQRNCLAQRALLGHSLAI